MPGERSSVITEARGRKIVLLAFVAAVVIALTFHLATDPPTRAVGYTNTEAWAGAVTAAGEGLIRGAVDAPAAGESTSSKPQAGDQKNGRMVASEGPLTPEAAAWLSTHFSILVRTAENRLDSPRAETGLSATAIAKDQFEALKDIYVYKAAIELVAEGNYLTFLFGKPPPRTPPGCIAINTTQYPLQNGKTGHAVVLVDLRHRRQLSEVYEMLEETRSLERWERIRDWNNRPESLRRSEIDEYLQLKEKSAGNPTTNLSSVEFVRYWRMEVLLRDLGAEVHHGSPLLFEQPGARSR